jgi:hypothetical protein
MACHRQANDPDDHQLDLDELKSLAGSREKVPTLKEKELIYLRRIHFLGNHMSLSSRWSRWPSAWRWQALASLGEKAPTLKGIENKLVYEGLFYGKWHVIVKLMIRMTVSLTLTNSKLWLVRVRRFQRWKMQIRFVEEGSFNGKRHVIFKLMIQMTVSLTMTNSKLWLVCVRRKRKTINFVDECLFQGKWHVIVKLMICNALDDNNYNWYK